MPFCPLNKPRVPGQSLDDANGIRNRYQPAGKNVGSVALLYHPYWERLQTKAEDSAITLT